MQVTVTSKVTVTLKPVSNMIQPNFFDSGSPFLQHPLLTLERTTQEVDFILETIAIPKGGRVLDVGCGFGRHSIEFAKRGFVVTGIDPAEAMILAAKQRAEEAGVVVDFEQVGAESFVAKDVFDTAVCLFTTLGQISATGENLGLVERVYAGLRSGGYFVVEVPQRDTAVSQLKPSDKFGTEERYTAVRRQYDPAQQVVTESFDLVSPEKTERYLLQYRLFSREEVVGLLENAGFTVTAMFANYAGDLLMDDSPTMVIIGQK